MRRFLIVVAAVVLTLALGAAGGYAGLLDQTVSRLHDSTGSFLEPPKPLIYGHRGAIVPKIRENTLQAVKYAAQAADGIEVDLQVSKDGYIVLFHDHLLENREISAYTWAELRKKGVQRWLPVLKYARKHHLKALWELKAYRWTDAQVHHVCGMVEEHGMANSSTLITGRIHAVEKLRRICPNLARGFISFNGLLTPDEALARAPVYVPSVARLATLTSPTGDAYRAAGLDLVVWTIKSREDYLKAVAAGASAVICDDVRACRIWSA